ncbi:MAG: ImpA family type VI secretion system protein [Beijerinckiaceae bacterium]
MSASDRAGELGDNAAPAPAAQKEPSAAVNHAPADPMLSRPEAVEMPRAAVLAAAATAAAELDPELVALCTPLSDADPCGPDLDAEGDVDYLNFFAATEGILPTSFFSVQEDGKEKPFFSAQDERSQNAMAALPGQIAAIGPLLKRTRDLRLLITRARLLILNRDLGGFAASLALVAEWLERYWDAVHPRPQATDVGARVTALSMLELPTVVFPLQYAPLFEAPRIGSVSYRSWMIASSEVKPRPGEQKHAVSALTDAMAHADPAVVASSRRHIGLLKASLGRVRNAFLLHGSSAGLEKLPALVDRISGFIDPLGSAGDLAASISGGGGTESPQVDSVALEAGGAAPTTLAQARDALDAIIGYYSRLEPSSPTLPLVRQAHQLIGKSFIEVMNILVPTQMDKAAFQIGTDQVFDLPVGRLSTLSQSAPPAESLTGVPADGAHSAPGYSVQTRSQAIALLEQVQRFFRAAEPSSPVPMLCERARALAERDFMGVLRDVLPKAALKNAGADK